MREHIYIKNIIKILTLQKKKNSTNLFLNYSYLEHIDEIVDDLKTSKYFNQAVLAFVIIMIIILLIGISIIKIYLHNNVSYSNNNKYLIYFFKFNYIWLFYLYFFSYFNILFCNINISKN